MKNITFSQISILVIICISLISLSFCRQDVQGFYIGLIIAFGIIWGLNILVAFTSDMQAENDMKVELIKLRERNLALEKLLSQMD